MVLELVERSWGGLPNVNHLRLELKKKKLTNYPKVINEQIFERKWE